MTTTERNLPIATNQHSLPAQPDDSAVMRRQYYDYIYLKGSKIAATNDVGDDGIVGGSSAITKTMRIRACLIGRQIRIHFLISWFPAMQENSVDPENPEAVANQNFTENSFSWTDQNTNIVFYERPISHFHIQ